MAWNQSGLKPKLEFDMKPVGAEAEIGVDMKPVGAEIEIGIWHETSRGWSRN